VMKVPIGGGAVTPLAVFNDDSATIAGLKVSATDAYFFLVPVDPVYGEEDGALLSVPLGGGPTTILAHAAPPFAAFAAGATGTFALGANSVYWRNSSGLLTVPAGGGVPVIVAADPDESDIANGGAGSLAVDSAGGYWTTNYYVDPTNCPGDLGYCILGAVYWLALPPTSR
jgi:hypothetical protein